MKAEITPFERWMRNQIKKDKSISDQKILDEMLQELKEKHESERKEKIYQLQKEIDKLHTEQMIEWDVVKRKIK